LKKERKNHHFVKAKYIQDYKFYLCFAMWQNESSCESQKSGKSQYFPDRQTHRQNESRAERHADQEISESAVAERVHVASIASSMGNSAHDPARS
jgi:hypothetical protein